MLDDDDVRFSWRKGIKAKERQYYGEDYSSENIKYRIYNKRYLKFLLKKNWCRGPSKNICHYDRHFLCAPLATVFAVAMSGPTGF